MTLINHFKWAVVQKGALTASGYPEVVGVFFTKKYATEFIKTIRYKNEYYITQVKIEVTENEVSLSR